VCYNTHMFQITLTIFDQVYSFSDVSMKVAIQEAINVLEQNENQYSSIAIKKLKKKQTFFRIGTDSKISCSLTKI
jgi:hypothetical protein